MSEKASAEEVEELYRKLIREAEDSGYFINPDTEFARALAEGIATNIKRYGYSLCPCRLTGDSRDADLDIICPCDYRDADLGQYDSCY